MLPALLVGALAVGMFTAVSRVPVQATETAELSVDALLSDAPATVVESNRAEMVGRALAARDWPALVPTAEDLGEGQRSPEWVADGCLGLESGNDLAPEENAKRCVYGSPAAKHSAVLFGDSTAISYAPAVRAALGDDWSLQLFTMAQCPAIDVEVELWSGAPAPECSDFRDWAIAEIRATPPDVLLTASSPSTLVRLASGAKDEAAIEEWKAGTRQLFDDVTETSIIMLDPPPNMRPLGECASPGSKPSDCVSSPDKNYVWSGEAIREVATEYRHVFVPSTLSWFCSDGGRCPSFIGTTPTLADGSHLTAAASAELAPLVSDIISLVKPSD